MEKQTKPQPFYFGHKRVITFLFALLFLYIGAVLAALPVLTFFVSVEGTAEELILFRAAAFIAAIAAGIPLLAMSVSLFISLRHSFLLYGDEEGLHVYTDVFPAGLIAWKQIKRIEWRDGRDGKTLRLTLAPEDMRRYNLYQRIRGFLRATREGRSTFISFSQCKCKAEEAASYILDAWRYYTSPERSD